MQTVFDVTGIDKAKILMLAYNRSSFLNMGFLQYKPGDMPLEKAREFVEVATIEKSDGTKSAHFDYVAGRPMKLFFYEKDGKEMLDSLYDRDHFDGATQQILDDIVESEKATEDHRAGMDR